MPSSASPEKPAQPISPVWKIGMEIAGWIGVAGLVLYFLAISWMKWPDPVIDFGSQLYIPWRLSEGAVLYRDIVHYYGPLSQYFNAVIFKIFGPGLLSFVVTNVIFFAIILIMLGRLLRRAWGAGAAILSTAVFVSVFGFSQYVGIGNYNYATPYAQESTHGFLICLVMVTVLLRWIQRPSKFNSTLAGVILGLTALLKPEFMLAGGSIMLTAFALRWRSGGFPGAVSLILALAGALLPTLLFALWFSCYLPVKDAVLAATNAWSVILTTPDIASNAAQQTFLGLDHPWPNLREHISGTFIALLLFAMLFVAARASRFATRTSVRIATGVLITIILGWLSFTQVHWLQAGRCLAGLMAIYVLVKGLCLLRRPRSEIINPIDCAQFLTGLLALVLLARMALNGRIIHFGFYQAALAALVIPAVLTGEFHRRFKVSGAVMIAGTLALFLPGTFLLAQQSDRFFLLKREPVGTGSDRFYGFAAEVSPTAKIVAMVSEFLKEKPAGQTVLVLPEGVMLNYLSRKSTPLPTFLFISTANGGEARFIEQLESKKQPPEWVILLSRDLREFGITRYGSESGRGKELLAWVAEHYKIARAAGGDPLDPRQQGVIIYQRK